MYWFDYEKLLNIVALEMAFKPSVSGMRWTEYVIVLLKKIESLNTKRT